MNYINICVLSGIAFSIGLFFEFVTPPLFENFVKSKFNLLPGSDLRKLYIKTPFPLNFKVYMFNLTNPDEFANGEKPKLQEIGPYFFEERKRKFVEFDDDDVDTLTYNYKNTFKFRPDLSGPGLFGDEIITMPHPLIATMLLAINVDRQPMLTFLKNAFDILFDSPQHMFYTGRVMDILFDGIPIECSSDDFQAEAVCSVFESGEIKTVQPIYDDYYEFSLLGFGNATDLGYLTVFRGSDNSDDLGRVVSFNEEPVMNVWDEDECNECNKYRGTDSTIFPPYMNANDGIWVFEPTICRSLHAHYVGKSEYMGIDTSEFALNIGSKENSKKCYCRDGGPCPKRGTFDMFECVGVPLIGTQPHFYLADESMIANIESGIKPEKSKHATYMHFEMTTGTLLSGAKRLQYNLEIVPIEDVPYMAKLREMYYPIMWLEESMDLSEKYVNQIKYSVILFLKIQDYSKWIGLIFGSFGIIISLWHCLKPKVVKKT